MRPLTPMLSRARRRFLSLVVCAGVVFPLLSSQVALAANSTSTLPAPWQRTAIGELPPVGSVRHEGRAFTLEAAGSDIGGASDDFLFVHTPVIGEATLSARFVPSAT